jgi:ketosteroid isomerase-like protein
MELWELTARESIRDLIARYNANGDTGRFAQVLELFAEDAVMITDDARYEGRDGIATLFTGTQTSIKGLAEGQKTHLRHNTSTHQIDLIDATHAKGRCYYFVLMPHGLDHWGRYVDEYEMRDGRWVFTQRKVTMDGYVPGGMGAASVGE